MSQLLNPLLVGKIIKTYMVDLNRVKRLPEEKIRRYQERALLKVIRYAYKVPLYNKKYQQVGIHPNDIKTIEDVKKIPFVTKKDFRESKPEDLIPVGEKPGMYSMVSTSGSTGQPVTLYIDLHSMFYTLVGFVRIIREHGIRWNKTRMAVVADLSPDSSEARHLSIDAVPRLKRILPLKNFGVFHVGEKPERLIKQIEEFNPEFIGAYPGILRILAVLKRKGLGRRLEPRILATSGAILDDYTREYIEKSFNAKVFDVYGATECSPIAFQCKNGNYHIMSDFAYVEFVDAQEKEEISGDGGNIVVTRLFGRGTPVVRYTGISDFVLPSSRRCNCGVNTPLIEKIEGRRVDSIVLPSGELVPPSSITGIPHKVMHMLNTDKIQQFQIIQQSLDEIDVFIVVDKALRNVEPRVEKISEKLKEEFARKLGNDIRINIVEVDEIREKRPGSISPPPVVISKVKPDSK